MTVTTSSKVNGDSSVREMVSSYPTLWGRALVSADRVETLQPFRGDTGWLTPHRFRHTSRRAPNQLLATAAAAFMGSAVPTQKLRHVNSVPDERSACLTGDTHSWSTFTVDLNESGDRAMTKKSDVRVRRVYEEVNDDDGLRVLVDRIWPRGVTKAKAALDEWCKDVAPSTRLRKWYGHDPAKFSEFTRRYSVELKQVKRGRALEHLRQIADDRRLTLLTGTKDPEISEAAVLARILNR
jgi:uncharacterized protein YeaO (DUF488 family)